MKISLALCLLLLASSGLDAAPAKPKPCPKGQVATTEKATGKQVCFAMQMILPPGQPAPIDRAVKPKPKRH